MIDHVSIPVRELKASARFYDALLAPLGMTRVRERPNSIGYGKSYPEFWINTRSQHKRRRSTAALTSACARRIRRRSMRFTPQRSLWAPSPMARPAYGPSIRRITMPRSSATSMATASKR